jgi:hypothetical protein
MCLVPNSFTFFLILDIVLAFAQVWTKSEKCLVQSYSCSPSAAGSLLSSYAACLKEVPDMIEYDNFYKFEKILF